MKIPGYILLATSNIILFTLIYLERSNNSFLSKDFSLLLILIAIAMLITGTILLIKAKKQIRK